MNCLRCGTEVQAPDVFCPDCQGEMAKHPVSRDTPVLLPGQDQTRRAPRKAYTPPNLEEQILSLRRRIRRQRIALLSLGLVCAALLVTLFFAGKALGQDYHIIGQNYRSTVPSTSTSANTEVSTP